MELLSPSEYVLQKQGGAFFPSQLNLRCGQCGGFGSYALGGSLGGPGNEFWFTSTRCANSACRTMLVFICHVGVEGRPAQVWMSPGRGFRSPVEGLDQAPQHVRDAYFETLETFNSSTTPRVVLNQARVVLEAIVHESLPESEGEQVWRLTESLRKLPEHVDFAEPLLEVAKAIKAGGDKGSHFSPRLKVEAKHRAQIMDLLDALIEYMYVIPAQTRAAHDAFMEMAGQEPDTENEKKIIGYAYLPPKLRKAIAQKADAKGIALEDYIRQVLEEAAQAP